jgi:hypothetical protein
MLQKPGVVAEDAFNPSDARVGHAAYWNHCSPLNPRSYYGPPSLTELRRASP